MANLKSNFILAIDFLDCQLFIHNECNWFPYEIMRISSNYKLFFQYNKRHFGSFLPKYLLSCTIPFSSYFLTTQSHILPYILPQPQWMTQYRILHLSEKSAPSTPLPKNTKMMKSIRRTQKHTAGWTPENALCIFPRKNLPNGAKLPVKSVNFAKRVRLPLQNFRLGWIKQLNQSPCGFFRIFR